jgi:uncharacterized protein YjbI with pentapeptide repeats
MRGFGRSRITSWVGFPDAREVEGERNRMTRAPVTPIAVVLSSLLGFLAFPASGAPQVEECTFAGRRPPIQEILAMPLAERPLLCMADLTKTDLSKANFGGANLVGTNFTEADLSGANLAGAKLLSADFTGADLSKANLVGAELHAANFSRAKADHADFTKSELLSVHFIGTDLSSANFTEADLTEANLKEADLSFAVLVKANLTRTKLNEADLSFADLRGADLTDSNLAGADVGGAQLHLVIFDPELSSIGSLIGIEFANGLTDLTFRYSPAALVTLRERFAKAGLRSEEREVTFAKLHGQQVKGWEISAFWPRLEAGFSYLAFDLPCRYGLAYGRPLRILGTSILLFALVYTAALLRRGRGAIWRIWPPDRIRKEEGQPQPEHLSWVKSFDEPPRPFPLRLCRALGLALLFSLSSAFQIGWRELNVGNWITRLQPREYTLRATGWVRVVAGVQSLLSVYLLALWALTYFGRPFE